MLIVDYAESRQDDVTWLADRLVERTQAVSKMGVEAFISTGGLAVTSDHLTFGKDDRWLIIGGPDVLLEDALWDEVPEALRRAAAFHKLLLARLFSVWRSNFLRAFDLGAIHMMARKNSILAPFERVTPDQWYVFKCDDQDEPPVKVDWSETRLATLQRAPRCGAKTRTGRFCQCPALRDRKRCRLHGGLSPGAPRGRKNGNFTNGDWTAEAIEERRWLRSLVLSFAKKGTGP
jgi:glucans biosynthesis protein